MRLDSLGSVVGVVVVVAGVAAGGEVGVVDVGGFVGAGED